MKSNKAPASIRDPVSRSETGVSAPAKFPDSMDAIDVIFTPPLLGGVEGMTQPKPYSLEEAVGLIHDIHMKLESIEDYRLKLKWWIGFVLANTDRPDGSKTQMIDEISTRLWTEHKIRAGKSTLYECAKLYDGLSGDYGAFVSWIDGRKRALHRPVFWYDVVNDLLGGRNNPEVIGRDEADERDYLDAERALEAIERIIVRAAEGNEEAGGVLEGLRQTVFGLMLLQHAPAETPRSDEYLRFVAAHGCVACGRPSEPHHAVGHKGKGIKGSDFGCVPLCSRHHRELHVGGSKTFERMYGVLLLEVVLNLMHQFVTGTWITTPISKL